MLVQEGSPVKSVRYYAYLAFDCLWHWRTGFPLRIPQPPAGSPPDADRQPYSSIRFLDLRRALHRLSIREGEDVFLDLGCGAGRAMLMAAAYPFRRVLGVEISPFLAAHAIRQTRRLSSRMRCPDIQVQCGDARVYRIPGDVTVIFLYNPFKGRLLEAVMENIADSLQAKPRDVTILYATPAHLEKVAASYPWLRKRVEISGYHRYAIYDARPPLPGERVRRQAVDAGG